MHMYTVIINYTIKPQHFLVYRLPSRYISSA